MLRVIMLSRFRGPTMNNIFLIIPALLVSLFALRQAQADDMPAAPAASPAAAPVVQAAEPPAPPSGTPPSRGTGYLVAGNIFLGLGLLNLATMPLCRASVIEPEGAQDGCLVGSAITFAVFAAIGMPLIVIGKGKAEEYKRWRTGQSAATMRLGFSAAKGQGALTFSGQF
jgi:hypothetical protein